MKRMKRASASLVLAMMVCAPGMSQAALCFPEDSQHVILSRTELSWPGLDSGVTFDIVVRGDIASPPDEYFSSVTVDILGDDLSMSGCKAVLELNVPGMDSARVHSAMLGKLPVVDVITESHGGSGNHFAHRLFAVDGATIRAIPAALFEHGNMGGFYVGDLGGGRGAGIVVWDALWEDGTHYASHRYRFQYYKWREGRLEAAGSIETRRKIDPEPDKAARAMGLPFRDQTGQELMPFAGFAP